MFCARPSLIQSFSRLVDDEWRHAGLVIETDEGLFVSGFGRKQKYALMPVADLARYSRVGIASVLETESEIEAAQRWVGQFDDKPARYPSSSIIVAWFLSLARARASRIFRWLITKLCIWYCLLLWNHHRDHVAFICSTFVLTAVNASRAQPLRVEMLSQKSAGGETTCTQPTAELLLARWLGTPSDIWRAIEPAKRCDLSLDSGSEQWVP